MAWSSRSNDDEDDYSSEAQPWTEAQWDAFMRNADARADRYGELMETLRADPQRDEKIGREMGWNRTSAKEEAGEIDEEEQADLDPNGGLLGATAFDEELSEVEEKEFLEEQRLKKGRRERNRAYKLSLRITRQINKILEPHVPQVDPNDPKADDDPRWGEVYLAASMPGVKISGAMGLGFSRENICGAIVNVRRGLDAVRAGMRAITGLVEDKKLPAEVGSEIADRLRELESAIVEFVLELRSQVDWDPNRPPV